MLLHPIQQKILEFIKKNPTRAASFSLRDIGEKLGLGRRAQIIAHHINQLEKKGFLRRDQANKGRYIVLDSPIAEVTRVNLYGFAECGPNGLLSEDKVLERIPLPTKTFRIYDPNEFFLVKARGKSMEPTIREGDLVLAHKQPIVDDGDMAIVVHNEMAKIKKVVRNSGDGKIYLKSLNEDFADEFIKGEDEDLKIIGAVRAIIKTPKSGE